MKTKSEYAYWSRFPDATSSLCKLDRKWSFELIDSSVLVPVLRGLLRWVWLVCARVLEEKKECDRQATY